MAASNPSAEFVRCFKEIRRQFGDQFEDARFKERLNSDANFAVLSGNLVDLKFIFDRAIKASKSKTLKRVHPEFPEEFKKITKMWAGLVSAYQDWKHPQLVLTSEEFERFWAEVSPTWTPSDDDLLEFKDADERDGVWEFDSDRYGAAGLVEGLLAHAMQTAEDLGSPPKIYRMLEAYEWFKKRGLNLDRFERRWKQVPFFAVPQHISDSYPIEGRAEGLYWLLDEAVKAFCFGCDGAAIAMCRAITEELVEEHYLENAQRNALWKNLEKAVDIYPQLKKHSLMEKVNIANKVLHEGELEISEIKKFSSSENFIRLWLSSLKELIEGAPQNKR